MITVLDEPVRKPCWPWCMRMFKVCGTEEGYYQSCPRCGKTYEFVINQDYHYIYNDYPEFKYLAGYIDPSIFKKDKWLL